MGHKISGQIFIGVFYASNTFATIMIWSLFGNIFPWNGVNGGLMILYSNFWHIKIEYWLQSHNQYLLIKLKTQKLGMKILNLKKISYIADICNQFILPNILCPWGCSQFIHKVGYIYLDTVIQQFIQKCNLSIVDVSKLSRI